MGCGLRFMGCGLQVGSFGCQGRRRNLVTYERRLWTEKRPEDRRRTTEVRLQMTEPFDFGMRNGTWGMK